MSTIVKVEGRNYRIGKLGAFPALHVVRRLAPAFAQVAGITNKLGTDSKANIPEEDLSEEEKQKRTEVFLQKLLGPLAEIIAAMTDETAEYIIWNCLEVVDCEEAPGAYSKLKVPGKKTLMYPDLGFPEMIELTKAVLEENLSGFLDFAQQK